MAAHRAVRFVHLL